MNPEKILFSILLFCVFSPLYSKDKQSDLFKDSLLDANGFDSEEKNSYINFSDFEFMKLGFDSNKIYVSNGSKGLKIQDNNAYEFTRKYVDIVSVDNNDKVIAIYPTKYSSFYDLFINYSAQGRFIKDISNSLIKIKIYIPEVFTKIDKTIKINFRIWNKEWKYYDLGEDFKTGLSITDIGFGWLVLCIDFKTNNFVFGKGSKKINVNESLLKESTAFSLTFTNPRLKKEQINNPILIDWIDISNIN